MQKIYIDIRFNLFFILIISFSIFYAGACSEKTTEVVEIELPASDLNYSEHILPLFINRCASRNGCHAQPSPARNLDLTTYQTTINHLVAGSTLLLIPGYGENSILYNILLGPVTTGSSYADRMPKDEQPLSVNNITGIRQWIDEGAPE